MKTKQEIQERISQLEASDPRLFKHDEMKERAEEAAYLRSIRNYLETEPTEEFVRSEAEKLELKLNTIEDAFEVWLSKRPEPYSKSEKQWKAEYNKEMGVKNLNNQLDNLKFILS